MAKYIAGAGGQNTTTKKYGIFTSDDGITWSPVSTIFDNTGLAEAVYCLATDGTTVVAGGYRGSSSTAAVLARSTDRGATWTAVTSPFTSSAGAIVWGIWYSAARSLWMAVGQRGSTNVVCTSSDGTTWTAVTAPATRPPSSVRYLNGFWWVTGGNDFSSNNPVLAKSSDDGSSWTTVTEAFDPGADTTRNLYAIEYSGSLFVAGGSEGFSGTKALESSSNGTTWTKRGPTITSIQGLAYSSSLGLFVAVGGGGNSLWTSPDGTTWTERTSNIQDGSWAVVWDPDNSIFIAVGSRAFYPHNTIATSTDGITWTGRGDPTNPATSGTGEYLYAVAYVPPPPPVLRSFSGSISPSGALANQRIAHVSASGGVTPSGALALMRTARRSLAGAISLAGDLSLVRTPSGFILPSGGLSRVAMKAFSGVVNLAGGIDLVASHEVLSSAASSLTGVLASVAGKTLDGSTDPAGSVRLRPQRALGGTVAPSSEIHLLHTPGTPTWVAKTAPPLHQRDAGLAVYAGKIYSFGGNGPLVYIQCYDPVTDSWSRKVDLPVALDNVAAITVNDKIWIFGEPVTSTALVYVYDPVANTVTAAAGSGHFMPAVNYGGKPIVAYANSYFWVINTSNQVYKLDPNNSSSGWTASGSPRPGSVWNGVAVAAIAAKLYYLGGGFPPTTAAYVFDTVAGTWTSTAVLPNARHIGKALVLSGKIWLVGGVDASFNPMVSVDVYDPVANTWSSGPADLSSLWFADGVVLNPPYILRDTGSSSFFEDYPIPPIDASTDIEIDVDVFPYPWGHSELEIDLTVDAVATVTSAPQLIPGFVFSGVQPDDGEG